MALRSNDDSCPHRLNCFDSIIIFIDVIDIIAGTTDFIRWHSVNTDNLHLMTEHTVLVLLPVMKKFKYSSVYLSIFFREIQHKLISIDIVKTALTVLFLQLHF